MGCMQLKIVRRLQSHIQLQVGIELYCVVSTLLRECT
jgi:hypothetical protein